MVNNPEKYPAVSRLVTNLWIRKAPEQLRSASNMAWFLLSSGAYPFEEMRHDSYMLRTVAT